MQFRYHFGSKPNTTNKKPYYLIQISSTSRELSTLDKYAPPLHANRLFWPDFNDSFLCSAAPLDILQEQKSSGDVKSDSSCHLDYGLMSALRRTVIQVIRKWGNPGLPLLPGCSYQPGQRCGHRGETVRNGLSEKQPFIKNWAFISWFSVLFWPWKDHPFQKQMLLQ